MLKILATHHQILNEPAQTHQQQSIIVQSSAKCFNLGLLIYGDNQNDRNVIGGVGRVRTKVIITTVIDGINPPLQIYPS